MTNCNVGVCARIVLALQSCAAWLVISWTIAIGLWTWRCRKGPHLACCQTKLLFTDCYHIPRLVGPRKTKRERDRNRQKQTETDRNRQKQTETDRNRQTDRQTDRQTERERAQSFDGETERRRKRTMRGTKVIEREKRIGTECQGLLFCLLLK